jgi:hypothetical protein
MDWSLPILIDSSFCYVVTLASMSSSPPSMSQPYCWKSGRMTFTLPKMGTWESVGTPKNLESNFRGQNTLHWGVLYIIGNLLKCRCRKWARMRHLDICRTSCDKKKGRKLNWQFDSQPLKVRNWPDFGVCRWNATHCWKALDESYKFSSNLIPIGGLRK